MIFIGPDAPERPDFGQGPSLEFFYRALLTGYAPPFFTENTMYPLSCTAPATLMVCGEHAVVQGGRALVAAAAPRVEVRLEPRPDDRILIDSALARHQTDLASLAPHPRLAFVLAAIAAAAPTRGFQLSIHSAIDPNRGLGSSAAVTVATLATLLPEAPPERLLEAGRRVIQTVQGRGSGADVAGAIYGGLLGYDIGGAVVRLPLPPGRWSLRYAGYKTPTAEVLALLADRQRQRPDFYADLYGRMATVSAAAEAAARARDWHGFNAALNQYQGLMEELGVCDGVQRAQIEAARPHCWAVKISGSGLGDCILALGAQIPPAHEPVELGVDGLRRLRG